MITTRLRRRAAAVTLSLTAFLVPAAATEAAAPPALPPAPALAPASTPASAPAAFTPPSCPVFPDKLHAAAVRPIDLNRITPEPVFRDDCKTLYRADGRGPEVVFKEGFHPKDTVNGQYDLESYVLKNQPSPFVSTSYDHDLFKEWAKWLKPGAFNYYIDAPHGIDVNKTIGDTHKYADQVEVAFPGGIAREFVIGVCPINKETRTEIMSKCRSNPHYHPTGS
ncbi:ADP-ribosyltransferase [Streptomyces apocyni]|uniref:ADP-ribosyltransferase n=1 Tax=Streptomyces apocyni TaxID=2654677 RepID=UPI002D8056BE|nr:ADP-ribosyltransferase [Streptomyces apocyni]